MKYIDYPGILNRKTGPEASRTFVEKLQNGFFDQYCSGSGLDIGPTGNGTTDVVSILPTAIGVDKDYPGYDGKTLPFSNESQDYIYTSHCLEHIDDWKNAIRDWYRVLKIDGYIVITVPHQFLYEKKKNKPSKYNGDHKRFYTPASLMREIEESLEPNTYRVRLLEDGDRGYVYSIGPERHCAGQCEISVVLQKIKKPTWNIE